MQKHRTHAAKTSSHSHKTRSHSHIRRGGQNDNAQSAGKILPMSKVALQEANIDSLLSWPMRMFGMMMSPWQGVWPFAALVENWLPGGEPEFPKVESRENDDEYSYMIDLPGIGPDEVKLHFENGTIMLAVEASEEKNEEDFHRYYKRVARRALPLPVYTDASSIKAKLEDNVLTVTIPKTDKPVKPQQDKIAIQAA